MTDNNTTGTATATLPDGYDDPGSFWYVPEELREHYDPERNFESPREYGQYQDDLRRRLQALGTTEAGEAQLAEYMRRYGVDRRTAEDYNTNPRGQVLLHRAEVERIAADNAPGGASWPLDAEDRMRHLLRLETARGRVRGEHWRAQQDSANTCPMCGQVRAPRDVTGREPVRGAERVRCCSICAAVIADVYAQRLRKLADHIEVGDGHTLADRAAEWIDANTSVADPDRPDTAGGSGSSRLAQILARAASGT